MRVAVVGMGHVGAVTAACLARDGHQVACLDTDPARQEAVLAGRAPVDEPGLDALFAAQVERTALRAASDLDGALDGVLAVIVAVGTPQQADGRADLGQIETVGRAIGRTLRDVAELPTLILRSTVPPGTTETVFAHALAAGSHGRAIPVVHLPEFFREGSAIADWRSGPFIVVGSAEPAAGDLVAELFGSAGPRIHRTDLRTAEALKYACNAWHATKVAFANEIGRFAAASGARPAELARLFASDRQLNLGGAYLQPGFAYGGPCLAKDLAALLEQARALDLDLPLLAAAAPANQATVRWWANRVRATKARQVAILGLVHRSGSRDLRASPYLDLAALLAETGCRVTLYEPALRSPPPVDFPLTDRLDEAMRDVELALRSRPDIASAEQLRELAPAAAVIDLFDMAMAPPERAS